MVQAAPAGIFSAFAARSTTCWWDADGSGPNAFRRAQPIHGRLVDSYNNGGAGPGRSGSSMGWRRWITARRSLPASTSRATNGRRWQHDTLWCFELKTSPTRSSTSCGDARSATSTAARCCAADASTWQRARRRDGLLDRRAHGRRRPDFPHGNGRSRASSSRSFFPRHLLRDERLRVGCDGRRRRMVNKFGSLSAWRGVKPRRAVHPSTITSTWGAATEACISSTCSAAAGIRHLGNGKSAVGAPSLDRDFNLVHVGSEAGIFYAVAVPLLPAGRDLRSGRRVFRSECQPALLQPDSHPECSASACLGPGVCGRKRSSHRPETAARSRRPRPGSPCNGTAGRSARTGPCTCRTASRARSRRSSRSSPGSRSGRSSGGTEGRARSFLWL